MLLGVPWGCRDEGEAQEAPASPQEEGERWCWGSRATGSGGGAGGDWHHLESHRQRRWSWRWLASSGTNPLQGPAQSSECAIGLVKIASLVKIDHVFCVVDWCLVWTSIAIQFKDTRLCSMLLSWWLRVCNCDSIQIQTVYTWQALHTPAASWHWQGKMASYFKTPKGSIQMPSQMKLNRKWVCN